MLFNRPYNGTPLHHSMLSCSNREKPIPTDLQENLQTRVEKGEETLPQPVPPQGQGRLKVVHSLWKDDQRRNGRVQERKAEITTHATNKLHQNMVSSTYLVERRKANH